MTPLTVEVLQEWPDWPPAPPPPCPRCQGTGQVLAHRLARIGTQWWTACLACGGSGHTESEGLA